MHKLGIHDRQQEFYAEGIYAMWMAYKQYNPNKGPLAIYFNYMIRNRLIDMIRKNTNDDHQQQLAAQAITEAADRSDNSGSYTMGAPDETDTDDAFWKRIRSMLTINQWKWVQFYIMDDMSLKAIAEQEGATIDAVKSWGRAARQKLQQDKEALARLLQ